jgi:hypothetical protein
VLVPTSEIMDRFSILILKWIHGADVRDELRAYAKECPITDPLFDLLRINFDIWQLESDIRKGKEGIIGLEEVGRRALAIRDKNRERINIKNTINASTKMFSEVKVNHASE